PIEAEKVPHLGLSCATSNTGVRPGMRHPIEVLEEIKVKRVQGNGSSCI
ncbi:hypothetical protein A2U01_0047683, partial [Trifolium medium]|nr:hypothetical protein [Trifolium medium]